MAVGAGLETDHQEGARDNLENADGPGQQGRRPKAKPGEIACGPRDVGERRIAAREEHRREQDAREKKQDAGMPCGVTEDVDDGS